MGGNLAKAPLLSLFYAAMLWFVMALLPQSPFLLEAASEFQMPISGLLLLIACVLLAVVAWAIAFSGEKNGGALWLILLAVSSLGLQWIAPSLRLLLLQGDPSGAMTRTDTLFFIAGGCIAGLLALGLAIFLYKTAASAAPAKADAHPKPVYKVHVLGLIIRLLVLPIVYFSLYYLSWYFLFWRVEAARQFHGAEEKLNFMGEFIRILINQGGQAAGTLLIGLVYALLCLPLLFRMQDRRGSYIATVTLLCLSGAAFYLIPSPVMPAAVRMAHLAETGAVMLVYGAGSSLLLHTSLRRQEPPEPKPVAAKKSATPGASRRVAAKAERKKPTQA